MPATSGVVRRFAVGDRVLCRTGLKDWSPGQVVEVDYREGNWTPGRVAAYRVELLDKSDVLCVPQDDDEICRRMDASRNLCPWWASLLAEKPGSHFARGAPEDVKSLKGLVQGKDINEKDDRGESALSVAVRFCWVAGARELLALGASANCRNDEHQSPLHLAVNCAVRELEITSLLLEANADPSLQDVDCHCSDTCGCPEIHRTPLHYSASAGSTSVTAALIAGRANLDLQDAQHRTALELSMLEGHNDVIELLLSAGADVNVGSANPGGQLQPLMKAVHENSVDLVKKLIMARAKVNSAGKQGLTALHLAARTGNMDMAHLLLEAGSDATLKSEFGTAGDLAAKNGAVELASTLGVPMATSADKGNSAPLTREELFID